MKVKRAEAENPAVISGFIDIVEEAYKLAGIDPTNKNDAARCFNIDETGFQTGLKSKRVIVERDTNAQTLAPTEGKANFSVLFCGNAAGTYIPPYVVYKGTEGTMPCGWVLNGPKGAGYTTSRNGWMDTQQFENYIGWLDGELNTAKIQKPAVVFMDGYSSHLSLYSMQKAKEKQIILVKLLPNSTHLLQALDVSVFGPAKCNWEKIMKQWYRQSRNKSITKYVFPVRVANRYYRPIIIGDNLSKNRYRLSR